MRVAGFRIRLKLHKQAQDPELLGNIEQERSACAAADCEQPGSHHSRTRQVHSSDRLLSFPSQTELARGPNPRH